jgi:hypothetical protein
MLNYSALATLRDYRILAFSPYELPSNSKCSHKIS